jgi:4-amino-4-deoxy-L-arabinose transferase-like glycosyltransferase
MTYFQFLSATKRRKLLILALCLFIGFTLRFYTFNQKSLWVDEVHTFNDSRDDLKGQIRFYKENPAYLHPPLFFILTHLFHPFTKPERDLRIIPLIFGTLSIPMIYFLARSFSHRIAIPCTLSLTFMVYHIYFSQEGRPYSMLMFFGMAALYFFMQHLKTLKRGYLFLVALFFAILFYTSYSSIPFIIFSQILWFYIISEDHQKTSISSFLTLNGLFLLFCIPWLLFVVLNYKGQPMMDPHHTEDPGALWSIMYWVLNDWVSNLPLIIVSVILLILFLFFSKRKTNALIFLAVFIFPIGSLYLFCKFLNITHFFTSRYFITFLPLFFISLYLSLDAIEIKLERLRKFMRLKLLFAILLITSNLVILPLYYRSEKQDLKGLVTYLKGQLRDGDNIFVGMKAYLPGILHYFGAYPKGRHHLILFSKDQEKGIEYRMVSIDQSKTVTIYHSKNCCTQYVADGNRLWIIVEKSTAKKFEKDSPCVLKGYFDGSVANFRKFPTDASMYLFLWDPKSPGEKGIDRPIE